MASLKEEEFDVDVEVEVEFVMGGLVAGGVVFLFDSRGFVVWKGHVDGLPQWLLTKRVLATSVHTGSGYVAHVHPATMAEVIKHAHGRALCSFVPIAAEPTPPPASTPAPAAASPAKVWTRDGVTEAGQRAFNLPFKYGPGSIPTVAKKITLYAITSFAHAEKLMDDALQEVYTAHGDSSVVSVTFEMDTDVTTVHVTLFFNLVAPLYTPPPRCAVCTFLQGRMPMGNVTFEKPGHISMEIRVPGDTMWPCDEHAVARYDEAFISMGSFARMLCYRDGKPVQGGPFIFQK